MYYSQFGEDVIISKILEKIIDKDYWCCEFGAYDGKHLSNTYHFVEEKSYKAIYIESDTNRFTQLKQNMKNNNVICINQIVENLDDILKNYQIPVNFDLLSIDIDGNEYYILQEMLLYKPKILVVEYNPSIHYDLDFIQNKNEYIGSSIKSLVELAKNKDYFLYEITDTNLIFINIKYKDIFEEKIISYASKYVSYLFQGYDGTLYIKGNNKMIWKDSGKNIVIS